MNKLLTLVTGLLFMSQITFAQVKFKINYNADDENYVVSIVPEETWTHPNNITGTGQVTLKVPSGAFEPINLKYLHSEMIWEDNARSNSPDEAPDFDYVSFGLLNPGGAKPNYVAGEEIPLFSFENAFGCTGAIELVNNDSEAFMPPNSQNANIGNQLTILGATGEAYRGILGDGIANCMTTGAQEIAEMTEINVFPNPVVEFLQIDIYWERDAEPAILQMTDAKGSLLYSESMDLQNGENVQQIDMTKMASGAYFLYLKGGDWKIPLERVMKQN